MIICFFGLIAYNSILLLIKGKASFWGWVLGWLDY